MLRSVAIALLGLVAAASAASDICGDCDPESCAPPPGLCPTGLIRDLCGCCYVCGRREGETCDSESLPIPYRGRGRGPCGEGLECRPRTDLAPSDPPEALCACSEAEPMCGSDGLTYGNACQLTEARYRLRNGLQAAYRGPCKSAPKILTPPENVSNATGGNVALSCEATGAPIPTIEWRVDRGTGGIQSLPSDDPKIAVQTRGGPSKYEVTSWLQLLNIQPDDDATYWCVARNDVGETSAAARVVLVDLKNATGFTRKKIIENNDL